MTDRTLRNLEALTEFAFDGFPGVYLRKDAVMRAIYAAEQPAPELCDVCGGHGMAGHPDSGQLCSRCHGSGGIKPAPDAVAEAPTDGQLVSACLSYNHGYGLMDPEQRDKQREIRCALGLEDHP